MQRFLRKVEVCLNNYNRKIIIADSCNKKIAVIEDSFGHKYRDINIEI